MGWGQGRDDGFDDERTMTNKLHVCSDVRRYRLPFYNPGLPPLANPR